MIWHRQAIFESKGDKLSSSAECRIRTQGVSETQSSADWMPADKPTELSRIKLKNLRYSNLKETIVFPLLNAGFEPKVSDTKSPEDSIGRPHDQRAFSPLNPLTVGFRTWLWRHTCLLLLISMLWNRQAIKRYSNLKEISCFSSIECRIRTQGLEHQIASRLNARCQTDWAIEDQAKNLNSTVRPYDQWAFSLLNLTAAWLSHLALAIYMFVVVNFDVPAQASDIWI